MIVFGHPPSANRVRISHDGRSLVRDMQTCKAQLAIQDSTFVLDPKQPKWRSPTGAASSSAQSVTSPTSTGLPISMSERPNSCVLRRKTQTAETLQRCGIGLLDGGERLTPHARKDISGGTRAPADKVTDGYHPTVR